MSQIQYVTYKAPLKSFDQDTAFLGILNPGRVCGFDTLTATGVPLQFTIGHALSGLKYKDPVDVLRGPIGKYITKQGLIIGETAAIGPLTIDSNAGNAFYRYDIVVATHNYVVGTQTPATYSIIKGALGVASSSPVLPALTDVYKQTILGIVVIPPSASSLTGVEYIKMSYLDTGDQVDAKLKLPNSFRGAQQWYQEPIEVSTGSTVFPYLFDLPGTGNTFKLNPPKYAGSDLYPILWQLQGIRLKDMPVQNGTRVTLKVNKFITFWNDGMYDPGSAFYNQGFRKMSIPEEFWTGTGSSPGVSGTKGKFEFSPTNTGICIVDMEMIDDVWVIKNISQSLGDLNVKTNKVNNYTQTQVFGATQALTFQDLGFGECQLIAGTELTGNNFKVDLGSALTGAYILRGIRPTSGTEFPIDSIINIDIVSTGNYYPLSGNYIRLNSTNFNTAFTHPQNYTFTISRDIPLVPGDQICLRKTPAGWLILNISNLYARELWYANNRITLLETLDGFSEFGATGGTWASGWGNGFPAYKKLYFRKDKNNEVVFEGFAQQIASSVGTTIGTLPSGYRPADKGGTTKKNVVLPIICSGSFTTGVGGLVSNYIEITPAGAMVLNITASSAAGGIVCFDNIRFPVD